MQSEDDKPFFIRRSVRVAKVAEALDIDQSTVRRLLDRGDLEGHKVGRGIRIYVDSVQAYQEGKRVAPPKPEGAPERKPRRKVEPSAELEEALAYMRSLGLRV